MRRAPASRAPMHVTQVFASRMTRRVTLALLLACSPCVARAETPADSLASAPEEPPPEAAEGDWSVERADSIAPGWVETTFSASGRRGSLPRTHERVRFRGEGAEGVVRAGDDPLRGGRMQAPLARGALRVGGLAPRWGRGLVLGAAAQPWSAEPDDRGDGTGLRGHAGDGASYRSRTGAIELLAARFGARTIGGARVRAASLALGAIAGRDGAQGSASLARAGGAAEAAADERGRWRAEFSVRRSGDRSVIVLRARGGHAAFRSLAEPRRAGPSRLAAAQLSRRDGATSLVARGAWWRYAPGADGAAAALELRRSLVHHAAVVFGCDEQHGSRRDPALSATGTTIAGMRQGGWCAWRGSAGGSSLELRHEWRGRRAFARGAVRRALSARGQGALPFGVTLAWSHGAWSTRGGESLWLAETDGDRLTLRQATGLGTRTRVELAAPLVGGRARGSVQWTESPARRGRPAWTMEWTRRMRQ